MVFKKLFNILRGLFTTQKEELPSRLVGPEMCWFYMSGEPSIAIGHLRYQVAPQPNTLIVHAAFNGQLLGQAMQEDPYWVYEQYIDELARLAGLGYTNLLAIVPVDRKDNLSLLLQQGAFKKYQEVFALDIRGYDGR